MASINDIENALVELIVPAIYPNGSENPSIVNSNVFIAPGQFLKENVQSGLTAGQSFVTAFALRGMTRNTTRFMREWVEPQKNTPTLTATIIGDTLTLTGTITPGEAVMVLVNQNAYAHKVVEGDTLDSIIADLGSQIPGSIILNNKLTVSNYYYFNARISVEGTEKKILNTQEGVFQVQLIAPTYELRGLIGNAIQLAIAENGNYLLMPDDLAAKITISGIDEMNDQEFNYAYRRDFNYMVEYHTVQTGTFQSIADTELLLE